MGRWGRTCAAFTALVAFMRRSGGGGVVFFCGYSDCSVYGALGVDVCGMYSVFIIYGVFGLDFCGVYEAFGLVFSFFFCGVAWRSVACSVYGAFGWDPCGVHNVCSDYKAFGLLLVFCGI